MVASECMSPNQPSQSIPSVTRLSQMDAWKDKEAIELTSRYSHISTALLQRRLRIGYARAARLMDQLEDEGIIASGEPGKSREVVRRSG